MFRKIHFSYFLLIFLVICYRCSSQETLDKGSEKNKLQNLKPAFAGQFYPGHKLELEKAFKTLFEEAEPKKVNNVIAIIAPHAGYVFSGSVAASAYNQVDPEISYKNVFVIASSHRTYFDGASVYSIGNCETPLGEVKVNIELAKKLINENKDFSYVPEAHYSEHSIEVQLPFLQYKLKNGFQIIPIVIGTQSAEVCKKLAEALRPYLK
jgi:AmmeMemoRadiSam system protein B